MTARRILLVDDEVGLREAIADSLRMRGYWVSEAGTASDAWELAQEQAFDVLITDIRLGEEDGLSLARRVRAAQPDTGLVFITGYGSLDLAVGAMRLGAADFIQKPFRISALARTLERFESVPREESMEARVTEAAPAVGSDDERAFDTEEWAVRELLWEAPSNDAAPLCATESTGDAGGDGDKR